MSSKSCKEFLTAKFPTVSELFRHRVNATSNSATVTFSRERNLSTCEGMFRLRKLRRLVLWRQTALSYTVKPRKEEHSKIRTCRLILWKKTLKNKNQKQTDLLQCSYEMVHLIKKFHHISVNQLPTIDNWTPLTVFRDMQIVLSSRVI